MFGYIKINKPELKIKDYQTYKGVYCTLCKSMGKQIGILSRFTLNYDFTFLALLKMAVDKNRECFSKSRCTFNPMQKCLKCSVDNKHIIFSVYVSVLMLYYKLKDNIKDEGFFKKLLMFLVYPLVKHYRKKALNNFIKVDETFCKEMNEQNKLENINTMSIDIASNPTGNMLGYIFSYGEEDVNQKRVLEHLGYCIGRYIFILDAVDDFSKDFKNGDYNTFVLMYKDKQFDSIDSFKNEADKILNRTLSEIMKTYDLLDIFNYKDILDNIIYEGLELEKQRVLNKEVKL